MATSLSSELDSLDNLGTSSGFFVELLVSFDTVSFTFDYIVEVLLNFYCDCVLAFFPWLSLPPLHVERVWCFCEAFSPILDLNKGNFRTSQSLGTVSKVVGGGGVPRRFGKGAFVFSLIELLSVAIFYTHFRLCHGCLFTLCFVDREFGLPLRQVA